MEPKVRFPTGPYANFLLRLAIVAVPALLVLCIGLGVTRFWTDWSTDRRFVRSQPVPFSHEHHVAGLGLDCRYCHVAVETAQAASLPTTQICMTCHSQIWTNAAVLEPVRRSAATGTPIAWTRVHDLPDYAFFHHAIHVAKGVACATCHGDVDRMPLLQKAASQRMRWCLDCHENPSPQYHATGRNLTDCGICHR
jgi:hypothetical protein